jgi:hypothetical protein
MDWMVDYAVSAPSVIALRIVSTDLAQRAIEKIDHFGFVLPKNH